MKQLTFELLELSKRILLFYHGIECEMFRQTLPFIDKKNKQSFIFACQKKRFVIRELMLKLEKRVDESVSVNFTDEDQNVLEKALNQYIENQNNNANNFSDLLSNEDRQNLELNIQNVKNDIEQVIAIIKS